MRNVNNNNVVDNLITYRSQIGLYYYKYQDNDVNSRSLLKTQRPKPNSFPKLMLQHIYIKILLRKNPAITGFCVHSVTLILSLILSNYFYLIFIYLILTI